MVESVVVEVITRERQCKPEDVNMDTRLSDLGIDSLQAITILYELEERFEIEIPNELMENLETVKDIVSSINKIRQPDTNS
ncbi:acyl carrier protein [Thiogranum longum]|uniref:Acyl carrier protein n=1 Tax=Thiogranum longum TaxID=1537524 RepID=A0A4R1HFE8_9GAMM|nr:phosphopantetheine-binding protein [Thiogranum longum]TCK18940.1 acyl carrier protein [Thiogranum longum]